MEGALASYRLMLSRGHGQLYFVAGDSGSGRRTTLRQLIARLHDEPTRPLVISGELMGRSFRSWSLSEAEQAKAINTLDSALGLRDIFQLAAAAAAPALAAATGPWLGVLAAFVSIAKLSTQLKNRLGRDLLSGVDEAQLPALLPQLLRQESTKRPVVLMLGNVDLATDVGITWFLDASARELPIDVRALVVLSLVGGAQPGPHQEGEPAVLRIARREVDERHLAAWSYLAPLGRMQIDKWLGPMEASLLEDLETLSRGNVALLTEIWAGWQDQGVLRHRTGAATWQLATGQEDLAAWALRHPVETRLRALTDDDGAAYDRLWEVLRIGSLEGGVFSADAVALAMIPTLEVKDLVEEIDHRLVGNAGVNASLLQKAGRGTTEGVTLYRFTSDLVWRLMRRYIASEELPGLSGRLARALLAVYTPHEIKVSRTLAELYRAAGEASFAEQYQRIADFDATENELRLQAKFLLGLPYKEWDPSQRVELGRTMNQLGVTLVDRSLYAQAQPLFERSVAILQPEGGNNADTARALFNLGVVLFRQGELNEGQRHLDRALSIQEDVLGPTDQAVARTRSHLAMLLYRRGDYEESRRQYEHALEIAEARLGHDNPETANILRSLAVTLNALQDPDGARQRLNEALAIYDRVYGPTHLYYAETLDSLAGHLIKRGNVQGRSLAERALPILEQRLGPNHAGLAPTLSNLGDAYYRDGDLKRARKMHERALKIREDRLGSDSPEVAASLMNVAALDVVEGKLDEAKDRYLRALDICRRKLPPNHATAKRAERMLAYVDQLNMQG